MWGDLCHIEHDLSNGKGQDAFDALKKGLSDDGIDELIINSTLGTVCNKYLLYDGFYEMVGVIVSVIMSLQKIHNEELAALKEKMRWRKYDDEPFSSESGNILLYYRSYGGENNFAIGDAAELEEQCAGVYGITHDRQVYKLNIFWRPFDFPEEPNADRTDSAQ